MRGGIKNRQADSLWMETLQTVVGLQQKKKNIRCDIYHLTCKSSRVAVVMTLDTMFRQTTSGERIISAGWRYNLGSLREKILLCGCVVLIILRCWVKNERGEGD